MESHFHLNGAYRFGARLEYELRLARDIRDRKKAWRFVRQIYGREGYASEDTGDLWYGIHDALPSTTTFLVEKEGAVVAALTLVFDSPIGLPADELYREELGGLRASGRRLCEIVSLVSEERQHAFGLRIVQHLFRAAYLVAHDLEGYTDFVITVNPRHMAYYQKSLLFERLGPERAYGKVSGAPAVLLRFNLATGQAAYRDRFGHLPSDRNLYRFFCGAVANAIAAWLARERGELDEQSLRVCFLENATIIAQASLEQFEYVASVTAAAERGRSIGADSAVVPALSLSGDSAMGVGSRLEAFTRSALACVGQTKEL